MIKASLIISVYKDIEALKCIFRALEFQTEQNFEIIVSEDGNSETMREFVAPYLKVIPAIQHLSQEDQGFRKTRALNRAILAAKSDYLIFIDGDCIPHKRFIESHVRERDSRRVCSARRLEMGKTFSTKLRNDPDFIKDLSNSLSYLKNLLRIHADGGKNPEAGFYSRLTHSFVRQKKPAIVGCNFSCTKEAMFSVNGFNEEFESPGLGEDSDLEWRLLRAGYETKNIKFLAPLFHLYHDRAAFLEPKNVEIFNLTKQRDEWRCSKGLAQAMGGG
jgi:glycosyltransferase involved in cell wall biosynthesis